ncbi:hypothetical protein A3A60_02730 [Candidatus Curtissbacteria bacterium RIFCSPLOWO2_01_FULL_42_26]|uniref:Uncharacterized protein n=1 Tax=Candidatus Curtissbacteria bacterium RIFCSPLOWO2_01_FULL_42_26 TaxID=1797729 RepID=A0A1F5I365_9BACT|nr:MAG: hypothetical protein A3A60_02730 [Candidatus Curtissbacteria bacterium RIFCSPLOWO2_01_FULL_42_26]
MTKLFNRHILFHKDRTKRGFFDGKMSNSKFRPKRGVARSQGRRLEDTFAAVNTELRDHDLVILDTEVFQRFSSGARSLEFLQEPVQDMSARRRL